MNEVHQKMLRYFTYAHLPEHLREVSRSFSDLAHAVARRAEEGGADPAETTVALRKLLESKDAAVRAAL